MATIENRFIQFSTNQQDGTFSIFTQSSHHPDLTNNSMKVSGWREDGVRFSEQLPLREIFLPASHLADGARELNFTGRNDLGGFSWKVNVRLDSESPFVSWQINITNLSLSPIYLEKITFLQPGNWDCGNIVFSKSIKPENIVFLSNGWQSWSYSGFYSGDEKMRRSHLGFLQEPMVINSQTKVPRQRNKFNSDFFALVGDRDSGAGLTLGFLSQKQHFGTVSAELRDPYSVEIWANGDGARLDPGKSIVTDPALCGGCELDGSTVLDEYLDLVAAEHDIGEIMPPPSGWCSWYYYYQDISEKKMMQNLNTLAELNQSLPLDLFQIDDGFQKEVGDWLEFGPKFTDGLKGLTNDVREEGMTPGLWLAPFIVHPRAALPAEHPDWLLKDKRGKPVRAGFAWNSLPFALDITIPEAMNYVREVVRTAVQNWGFSYLKLDFLYAAALNGEYQDRSKTRAMVLREGMEAIREVAGPETFLLGCGLPLGSGVGIVDAMRISADVSGSWKPDYFYLGFLFKNEPHMPSAENAIHNVIVRSPMHKKWWVNDPDCLLVRDDSKLSLHEVQSLATIISMTGGSLLLSDDMQKLSQERLLLAASLVPPINKRPDVLDWAEPGTPSKIRVDLSGAVGDWYLLSYSNWNTSPRDVKLTRDDFNLEENDCFVYNFWENQSQFVGSTAPIFEGRLEPHQTLWISVREKTGGTQYIGGNLHASQGLEINRIVTQDDQTNIEFSWAKNLNGTMEVFPIHTVSEVILDETPIAFRQTNIGSVHLDFNRNLPGILVIK